MAWRSLRGALGSGVLSLVLVAPVGVSSAQNLWPLVANPAPQAAGDTPEKLKPRIPEERQQAHKSPQVAAAKAKPPVKHVAVAKDKKLIPPKRIAAAKKAQPTKKAEPTEAPTAAVKPAPASYTITTTRGNVTTTTTRIVPQPATLAAALAPVAPPATAKPVKAPEAKPAALTIAATPVSLAQPAAASPTLAALAATVVAPLPANPLAATTAGRATQPSDPKTAASFVSSFLAEAFRLAKSEGTSLQRRARLADLFAREMDVTRIAGYTAGSELSGAASDIQQRFCTILVSYLVETYYPELELASDPLVRVETTPVDPLPDGTAVVWTTFTKEGWGSQAVKWHLVNEDGHYRIVDIFSAGASLMQMERDTFLSVMRNGGLSELMAKLDQRTKELATAATD